MNKEWRRKRKNGKTIILICSVGYANKVGKNYAKFPRQKSERICKTNISHDKLWKFISLLINHMRVEVFIL
jgi:hypothetical protein